MIAPKVNIRRATEEARSLGTFTRSEFAAELGISPLEAGKWLRRLQDERDTIRREGAKYVFDDPETREAPPPPLYEGVDVRVVARKLNRFSAQELAAATGLLEGTAHNRCKWLLERGVVRDSGKKTWPGKAVIYEAIEVEKTPAKRVKRKPVEQEMREKGLFDYPTRNGHHAKRLSAQNPYTQQIIDAAYEMGYEVSGGGKHFKIKSPNGASLTISKTPGVDKPKKDLAQARRWGLPV